MCFKVDTTCNILNNNKTVFELVFLQLEFYTIDLIFDHVHLIYML